MKLCHDVIIRTPLYWCCAGKTSVLPSTVFLVCVSAVCYLLTVSQSFVIRLAAITSTESPVHVMQVGMQLFRGGTVDTHSYVTCYVAVAHPRSTGPTNKELASTCMV